MFDLYVKTNKETGQKIKEERKAKNITQAEFSKQFGISQGTLSRIENGTVMFIEFMAFTQAMKWVKSLGQ